MIWPYVRAEGRRGIIFAYDEAQNLADHAAKDQYPLSLLLDVFQSLQRKGIRFMLVLTGLPTLFPKLVEAKTYTERMFHTIFLDPLNEEQIKDAIFKPIQKEDAPFVSHPKRCPSFGYKLADTRISSNIFDAKSSMCGCRQSKWETLFPVSQPSQLC
jgi:deoxyribodipyrimidine photolyase